MITLCSHRSAALLLLILATGTLNFAFAEDGGDQDAITFRSDLALVSIPAGSNEGCPTNTTRFNVTGNGSATTLGVVTVSEFVCLDTMSLLFTAQFRLTAQNGDQVFGTASGYGVPTTQTTFDVRGTWTFRGGTGQYRRLRGNGNSLGHVNLVTGASPHELIGNISNSGSSR